MNLKEAINILEKHNEWRRYNGPLGKGPQEHNPALIGEAIDYVVKYFKKPKTFGNSKLCEDCKKAGARCECLGGGEK